MTGWLARLLGVRPAAKIKPATRVRLPAPAAAPQERDVATALAEAEERMKRLPPEKAQLIRSAMLVRKAASQSVLSQLDDHELDKLRKVAEKALLGRES
jgi:hypothetical protein